MNITIEASDFLLLKGYFIKSLQKQTAEFKEDIKELNKPQLYASFIQNFEFFIDNLIYSTTIYNLNELRNIAEIINILYLPLSQKKIKFNSEISLATDKFLEIVDKLVDNDLKAFKDFPEIKTKFQQQVESAFNFAALSAKKEEEDKISDKPITITSSDLENLKDCIRDIYTQFSYLFKNIEDNLPDRYRNIEWYKNHLNYKRAITQNLVDLQKEYFSYRQISIAQMLEDLEFEVRSFAMKFYQTVSLKFENTDIKLDIFHIEQLNEILLELLKNSVEHGFANLTDQSVKTNINTNIKNKYSDTNSNSTINKDDNQSSKSQIKDFEKIIEVKFFKEPEYLTVEIIDNGRGFDLDDIIKTAKRNRLLTEFDLNNLDDIFLNLIIFYAKNSRRRGAGLKNVKDIIEALNGIIRFNKVKEKSGAQITIRFPLLKKIV